MVIKYCFRVYRNTSKYCRIMARSILNNIIPSMITFDPHSRMFCCSTSAWKSCYRADIISPKTSDGLRAPIHIFVQVSFLFTPKIDLVPWCLTELDLSVPGENVGANLVRSHPNTCNHIVDLRLNPKLKGEKEKGARNIGKQAQYLTNDHTYTACFYHIFHHLRISQLVLLHRYPPPPSSSSL